MGSVLLLLAILVVGALCIHASVVEDRRDRQMREAFRELVNYTFQQDRVVRKGGGEGGKSDGT